MDSEIKVAVVTGGAQGIGLSIVSKLLSQKYKVIICDINEEIGNATVKKLDSGCFFVKTDTSDIAHFERVLYNIKDKFGRIDVLVNNAAYIDDSSPNWQRQIDVNIKGAVSGCYVGFRILEKGGTIVNISSTTAAIPYTLMPVYCMTKAAILHLTTTLGREVYMKKFNIRVLAILPGMTETPSLVQTGKRYFFEEMSEFRKQERANMGTLQPVENVAECFMKALEYGKNGSLWVARDNKKPEILEVNYTFTEAQN